MQIEVEDNTTGTILYKSVSESYIDQVPSALLLRSLSENYTDYVPRTFKEKVNYQRTSSLGNLSVKKRHLPEPQRTLYQENKIKNKQTQNNRNLEFKMTDLNANIVIPPIPDPIKKKMVMDLIRTDAVYHEKTPDHKVWIGTHHGTFHCDEVLAIAMLRTLPEYKDAAVVRSRDKEVLDKCDIVVDVGAEYNPDCHRYDHHQRGFEETMDGYKTKLSSSGLIYKHFGKRVMMQIFNQRKAQCNANSSGTELVPMMDESVIDKLFIKVYEDFMEHIDGIDNGIPHADATLNYKIESHMSSRIGRLNPSWNMESSNEEMERRFSLALQLASTEFFDYLISLAESWWPGRLIVETAFEKRLENYPSGEIIVLDRYCPWIAHLEDIETENNLKGLVKYVLYMDSHGAWRIHAAPVEVGSFQSRLALPEAWRGVREQELDEVSGISDCTFVHANGFIGGNKTLEGTIKMAVKSIQMQSL